MNAWHGVGNLTRDPETGTTQSGVFYCRFTVACQRRFKDANGQYQADFIQCTAWRQTGEFVIKYFQKGSRIGVSGSITTGSYQAQDAWSVSTHLTWAYYETIADLWLQSLYNISVPLNKEMPIIPMNDPARVAEAFAAGDFAEAMNKLGWYNGTTFEIPGEEFYYTDSLALALWFVPNSHKLLRTADLIQLEMRYKEQYLDGGVASFLMREQNTYCRISATAKLNSTLPILSLGGTDSIDSVSFQTIRYAGY